MTFSFLCPWSLKVCKEKVNMWHKGKAADKVTNTTEAASSKSNLNISNLFGKPSD